MTWATVLQSISSGFALIGAWFLYDLVREFKSFKSETKTDISNLKQERATFQTTVRNAELSISIRVVEMQKVHNDFNSKVTTELSQLKLTMEEIKSHTLHAKQNSKNYQEYLLKSLELCRTLNERTKAHEKAISGLNVRINEVLIVKSKPQG